MKISTKSRYGTRLLLGLAKNYGKGFLQLGDIASNQGISLKYLEQIIIPLRKAGYVEGVRGARGGYRLLKAPEAITVGEIVALLEEGAGIVECYRNPDACERYNSCLTRDLWKDTSEAMYDHLNRITLADLLEKGDVKGLDG